MNSTRFVCLRQSEHWLAELSYIGGTEAGKGNPRETDVRIRMLARINPHWPSSPWHVQWEKSLGNLNVPTGAWNGVYLVEIVDNRIFLAASNSVICVSPETGEEIWRLATGNTPIYKVMSSESDDALIVYNGYFGYESDDGKGNIAKLSLDGHFMWRADLPSENDIYANPPYYKDGELYSNSWGCFCCKIAERDGKIVDMHFTK